VDVRHLGVLGRLVVVLCVRRRRADDAREVALVGVDGQALGPEDARVPAADQLEEAVLVDVPHHEPDLLYVGGYHDVVVGFAPARAGQVAHRARVDPVDVRLDRRPDPLADPVLVARHAPFVR